MPFVHLVIGAALLEYLWFAFAVGKARETYKVSAPATTGNEIFERNFRVQMNTLEQLIIFIPSILIFAHYFDARIAAAKVSPTFGLTLTWFTPGRLISQGSSAVEILVSSRLRILRPV